MLNSEWIKSCDIFNHINFVEIQFILTISINIYYSTCYVCGYKTIKSFSYSQSVDFYSEEQWLICIYISYIT